MVRYFLLSGPYSHLSYFKSRGFIQQSHRHKSRLEKLSRGDYVVLYAGRLSNSSSKSYNKIVGIAQVTGRTIKTVKLGNKKYYRLDVKYLRFRETPLGDRIKKLSFVKNKKKYNRYFKSGVRQLSKKDFHILCGYCY